MKQRISILAVSLCAMGFAFGATTTPIGYTTLTLKPGFNLVSPTVHPPVVIAGFIDQVDGVNLIDEDVADFSTVLPSGSMYILEITSGTLKGLTQDFNVRSGNQLTMPAPLGVSVGDGYAVRIAPTLETLFGTTNTLLKKSNNSSIADNIHIPNGVGGYNRYFVNTAGTWRSVTPVGNAPNIPIVYLDAFFVERKDPEINITITGEVKLIDTRSVVAQGFNAIGINYPAGATLQNFGFQNSIKKSNNGSLADNIYIPDGAGGYVRYFMNNSNAWRVVTPAGAAPANVPLTTGVFYHKYDPGTASTLFTPPSGYPVP